MRSRTPWIFLLAVMLLPEALGAQFAHVSPNVPKELRAPGGQLILHLHGKGKQIYLCQNADGAYAWKLKAPDARLFGESGELAGTHFAGPTWQANDGSRVTGKLAASVPAPDSASIPWLLLTATSHDGKGVMSRVQNIQRLNTKGGLAPATGCTAANNDKERSVPYEADYYFYGTPQPGLNTR